VSPEPGSTIIQAAGRLVFPGLIDTHVHGGSGYDVTVNGTDGVLRVAQSQLRFGTTGFLPTTIAARHGELLRAVEDVLEAEKSPEPASQILGMHIEGPYINVRYKGAQPVEGIRDPNEKECRELLEAAQGRIRVMTLAPELPGATELIRMLVSRGVIASLGHSAADYDTALAAIDAGATHATHLFNAMSGVTHRKPGLAAACLSEPRIRAEIICDGVHVDPRMIKLAARLKRPGELVLITDASAAQGCPDGDYTLGGVEIRVRAPLCTLMDGVTIASSVLTMNKAVRNARAFAGLNLVDVARMGSLLPAQICGVGDRKGSIEEGKDADLAVFDTEFNTCQTVLAGEVVWPN
jgi:N-acetylglucosamine-6-phosphate deacetylase